jgi:hypothetical protein
MSAGTTTATPKLRSRAELRKDPEWKSRNRRFSRLSRAKQGELLFRLLHRWPQRSERPVAQPAALRELHDANRHVARFNLTREESLNYLRAADLFRDAANGKRDLAAKIHVEILRQGLSDTRPWPAALVDELRGFQPLVQACADWEDTKSIVDARVHPGGKCIDREGEPTDSSRCVLEHRRTEHYKTALEWCGFVRISTERLQAALAARKGSVAGPDWPTIEDRLWDGAAVLSIMSDLFYRLSETIGPVPDGRKGKLEASREVLMLADQHGIPEERVVDEMLKLYSHAICRVLPNTRWSNRRSHLSKHLRDVRDGDGRSRVPKGLSRA